MRTTAASAFCALLAALAPLALASSCTTESLVVTARVQEQFARTVVTSTLRNTDTHDANDSAGPSEALFRVQIPENAYISNFSVRINSREFVGTVMEKEAAKKVYGEQRAANKTTGMVEARGMNTFGMAVSLGPGDSAEFTLTYEQVLTRRLGTYDYVLNVNPAQVVELLRATVEIRARDGVVSVATPSPDVRAIVSMPTPESAVVTLDLSPVDQRAFGSNGIAKDFVVRYAVGARPPQGTVVSNAGFVAHWFSPSGLAAMAEDIVFVIDHSGSMSGTKIAQARQALAEIVRRMPESNYFGIVAFDDDLLIWRDALCEASLSNKNAAQSFIARIEDSGSTDIDAALDRATRMLNAAQSNRMPIIVLLTDGQPTSGVTNPTQIRRNMANRNTRMASVFTLGFGMDLDYELLRNLALDNRGFDRRIYEESDAVEQLTGFYDEIATPSLRDIEFVYTPQGAVLDPTSLRFPFLFQGSEILVAARLAESTNAFTSTVKGNGGAGPVSFVSTFDLENTSAPVPVERIWASMKVASLIAQMQDETENATHERLYRAALDMSIKYNLVTELTSMVIVLPDDYRANSSLTGEQQDNRPDNYAGTGASERTGAVLLVAAEGEYDGFFVPESSPFGQEDPVLLSTPPEPSLAPAAAAAPLFTQAPPQLPQCQYCRQRLEDMREGCDGEGFPDVAERWEAAWALSQLPCYGACASNEFCALHCVPHHVCASNATAAGEHDVLVYRSRWERSKKRGASETPGGEGGEGGQCASGAGCVQRLERLARADWVRKDAEMARAVQRLLAEASLGRCQGFCQTSYFCKLHHCPAHTRKVDEPLTELSPGGQARKVSKFVCQQPHDKVANGRHHELFAFYCSDECCAPGKWFAREETHRKSRKRKETDTPAAMALASAPPMLAPDAFYAEKHENAAPAAGADGQHEREDDEGTEPEGHEAEEEGEEDAEPEEDEEEHECEPEEVEGEDEEDQTSNGNVSANTNAPPNAGTAGLAELDVEDPKHGKRGGALAAALGWWCAGLGKGGAPVAAPRRRAFYWSAIAVEALLLCGAVAAIAVLASRPCGAAGGGGGAWVLSSSSSGSEASGAYFVVSSSVSSSEGCPPLPDPNGKTLCYIGPKANQWCVDCRPQGVPARAWACDGTPDKKNYVVRMSYESGVYSGTITTDDGSLVPFNGTTPLGTGGSNFVAKVNTQQAGNWTLMFY
eukprot:m51a1_g14305 putative inter-alpha-trypsin inhibitor heavy chain h3 (1204) ;mRNA; f:460684-465801